MKIKKTVSCPICSYKTSTILPWRLGYWWVGLKFGVHISHSHPIYKDKLFKEEDPEAIKKYLKENHKIKDRFEEMNEQQIRKYFNKNIKKDRDRDGDR